MELKTKTSATGISIRYLRLVPNDCSPPYGIICIHSTYYQMMFRIIVSHMTIIDRL